MNRTIRYIIITGFLALYPYFSFAGNCIDEIGRSIGKGNAEAVAAYFDDNLSLSLPGSQSIYSNAQAKMILADFFEKNSIKNVSIERSGNNNDSKFAIGKLITSKGNYRIYLVVKQKERDCIIKELRLEK
jgi:hypothetical protein